MNEMLDTFYTATGLTTRAHQIRDTLIAPLPFGPPSISNMKQAERNEYISEDPHWSYNDFYYSYDYPISHNVPDDYGVTPFFSARRSSALSQLNVSNIAPIITSFKFRPGLPRVGDDIRIKVKAYDDSAITSVVFRYEFNNGGYIGMDVPYSNNAYRAVLPAFTTNGTLTYYVEVFDDTGKVTYEPYGGSSYAYSVDIDSPSLALAVTELNYHPHDPEGDELLASIDEDDFEFIELRNTGATSLQLGGYELSDAVAFVFPSYTLAPGEFVLVVRNTTAYEARYGTTNIIAGVYTGKFSDSGEKLRLLDSDGREVIDFTYSDGGSWPGRSDGDGSALEVLATAGDFDDGDNWRSSSEHGGTPGYIGLGPDNRIVINEVLTHTDLPLVDSIELYNTP